MNFVKAESQPQMQQLQREENRAVNPEKRGTLCCQLVKQKQQL